MSPLPPSFVYPEWTLTRGDVQPGPTSPLRKRPWSLYPNLPEAPAFPSSPCRFSSLSLVINTARLPFCIRLGHPFFGTLRSLFLDPIHLRSRPHPVLLSFLILFIAPRILCPADLDISLADEVLSPPPHISPSQLVRARVTMVSQNSVTRLSPVPFPRTKDPPAASQVMPYISSLSLPVNAGTFIQSSRAESEGRSGMLLVHFCMRGTRLMTRGIGVGMIKDPTWRAGRGVRVQRRVRSSRARPRRRSP